MTTLSHKGTDGTVGVKEASKRIGLERRTIYRLIRTGELAAFRPGSRKFRFRISDIEAFIASRRVKGGAA